jgi:hypothetical protein
MAKKPYLVGGLALFTGFVSATVRRMPRVVSAELMQFHRQEQMKKLRAVFRTLLRGRKVDGFSLATEKK